jgi:RNA polymerase sigma factor (sigma-70 family)
LEVAAVEWVREASGTQFEAFVAASTGPLFRTGYLMTGDAADAEDLVQETFLRVARRWRRVGAMEYPIAYARRVLVSLVIDSARRRARHQSELASRTAVVEPADENSIRALRGVEDLAELQWALGLLSVRTRAVLVLRYWADLPVAEVADLLGCSEGAAAGGAVGLAAAATVFALLPSTSQPTSPKATVTLDAFTFKLPVGYVAKPSPACNLLYVMPVPGQPGSGRRRDLSPGAEKQYATAAAANGGCISLKMSTAYTPKPGNPDPNKPPRSRPVRVGDHHGFATGYHIFYSHPIGQPATRIQVDILVVQVKAAHGRRRDVFFYTTRLPLRTVIKIAVSGLG